MVTKVTSGQLKDIVLGRKKTAMVLFTGSWCVDCMAFKPIWEKWNEARKGSVLQLDIERGDPAWTEWNIREIPTVAVFVDGVETAKASDRISSDDLDRLWRVVESS